MRRLIESFCHAYGLGSLLAEPEPVTGGLMHAMYRVRTSQGDYAVKALNADIMQRPTAYQNMVNSEIVSSALRETVPLVAARAFGGKHVIQYEGAFWMVFDWLEGKSVYPPDLTETHCAVVGDLLGRIHTAQIHVESIARDHEARQPFAWHEMLAAAKQENAECYSRLQDYMDEIIRWDHALCTCWPLVQSRQVISHRDLDPKNILWKDGQPFIIDWEAAGYVNPLQELMEVLAYWIVEPDGRYSRTKFGAMLKGYAAHCDLAGADWEAALSASYAGMLGWLAYNVRRAAGLEGSGPNDRMEGNAQVRQTIGDLLQYQKQMALLKDWLTAFVS